MTTAPHVDTNFGLSVSVALGDFAAGRLTQRQRLACALRILANQHFAENLAGHITVADSDDGTMLVNPWGLWWSEVTAGDICRIDADGSVVDGTWQVTPAIHIHSELHRAQPANRVVIHNHPYWSTVLAALGHLPEIFHQTGCLFEGDMVFVDEYDGEISDPSSGAALAAVVGSAPVALLANHGVLVCGASLEEALYRAASFDRQCKLAYDVLLAQPGTPGLASAERGPMRQTLLDRAVDIYWAGAVRALLRNDPSVLAS